jgi:hypothetical protein
MQGRTGAAKERSGPGANRPQMAVPLTAEDEEFRGRIRSWLEVNLSGEFAAPRPGRPGREHEYCERRLEPCSAGAPQAGLSRHKGYFAL